MAGVMISSQDRKAWREALDLFQGGDSYYQAGYHEAFAEITKAQAWAYYYAGGDGCLFHPFLLSPINSVGCVDVSGEKLSDIESVYGYSGPLATCHEPAFLKKAWLDFDDWCFEQQVVCEFLRFHPLLETHRNAHPDGHVIVDRQTIAIDLCGGEDAIMARYSSQQRNRLRKAEAAGLEFWDLTDEPDGLDQFLEIYNETMTHVGAGEFYFFDQSHLVALCQGLGSQWRLLGVRVDGRLIACGLFMFQGDFMHYHLGGSLVDDRSHSPNNLLFHSAALLGAREGCRWLHMGGGRTNAPDDTLFRFKKRFVRHADGLRVFHLGKRILNQRHYDWLGQIWRDENPGVTPAKKLQFYRDS